MKALYFLLILLIPFVGFGQTTYVPDDIFEQKLIDLGCDDVLDDYVLIQSVDTISSLMLTNLGISNLEGIESFTSLKNLKCDSNQLEVLNLNNNHNLEILNCTDNNLDSLNISNCIELKQLRCWRNQLKYLDLNNNYKLEYVGCGYNEISYLNFSNHDLLVNLGCGSNQLDSINLSVTASLKTIYCASNNLTELDVSNSISLYYLGCWSNNILSLDLSQNINLTELRCHYNNLHYLNIKNGNNVNFNSNSYLTGINTTNNQNLFCINVDSVNYSIQNWTTENFSIDSWNNFSSNCDVQFLGCLDSLACNYSSSVTLDNGTCIYVDEICETCELGVIIENDLDNDGICDGDEIAGCTDLLACNYNVNATDDDASCDYVNELCESCVDRIVILNDLDNDEICDGDEIAGCTDLLACNYNVNATDDDGSCYSLSASIIQSGDSLISIVNKELVNVNWYNVQTVEDSIRYWLMAENSTSFIPSFDCSYFIIANSGACSYTSPVYYYSAEAKSIGQFSTSPNPTDGIIKVKFENNKNQFVRLFLVNNNGYLLDEFLTKNNEFEIDLSSYPAGTYHISFVSPDSKDCLNENTFQKIANTIILK